MFQMQICVIVVLLFYSGSVSGGLEKVLRQAQFIADIYRQFPHSCIFIINPETQQQGEDWFCIIYNSCVFVVNRNVLIVTWDGECLCFLHVILFLEIKFCGWKNNKTWIIHIYQFRSECSTLIMVFVCNL